MRSSKRLMTAALLLLCVAACSSKANETPVIELRTLPKPPPISESQRLTALKLYQEGGPVTFYRSEVLDLRALMTMHYTLREQLRAARRASGEASSAR